MYVFIHLFLPFFSLCTLLSLSPLPPPKVLNSARHIISLCVAYSEWYEMWKQSE